MDRPSWMPKISYEYVRTSDGQLRWGPRGAAGILFHHPATDTYLLGHRSPEVQQGDTWGVPGGAIDPGEDPYQAALREAQEEFGNVPQHEVTGIHTASPVPDWSYHTVMADVPEQFEPEYADSWETQGHGWFTPEEISRLDLHPGFAAAWNGGHLRKSSVSNGYGSLEELEAAHPDVVSHAIERNQDGSIVLHALKVDPTLQNQGLASAYMKDLTDYADANGRKIALTAEPYSGDPGLRKSQLRRWYEGFGFIPNKGRNKDFAFKETHIRHPRFSSKTAKHGFFYHTAPAEYRQQIEEQGLIPTDEAPISPWADLDGPARQQQPHGVYLWDNPGNAHSYAYNLEGRKKKPIQGDEGYGWPGEIDGFDEDVFESPEYHEYMKGAPEDGDDYHTDEWYDYESQFQPPRKPLYDIWKVNTLGMPVHNDPEMANMHGELTAEQAQQRMNDQAQGISEELGDAIQKDNPEERWKYVKPYDPYAVEKTEGHRWYSPQRVEPQRLTLHKSIYADEMTDRAAEDAREEGKEIPTAWHQVPLNEWNEKARQRYLGDPNVMREIAPQDR